MRVRAVMSALAVGAATFLAAGGTAQAAPGPLRPTIVCDQATGTVSTAVTGGNFVPNHPLTVDFQVQYGSAVSTAGRQTIIPQRGQTTSVPTRSLADGTVAVTGYSHPWTPSAYVFYTETVRVSVKNSSGYVLSFQDAICTKDPRTTVTLTCDLATLTVTAQTAGVGYAPTRSVGVDYKWVITSQATPTGPRWTQQQLGPYPDVSHARVVTDGAWSDTGYTRTWTAAPYYYRETLTVTVRDLNTAVIIGRGTATCLTGAGA